MAQQSIREGLNYLSQRDTVMDQLIKKHDVPVFSPHPDPFISLCDSIVGQQLSMKAAHSIQQKVYGFFRGKISPEGILETSDEDLKALGLSRSKVSYLKDLSQKVHAGELKLDGFKERNDEEIISQLTTVRGIGTWTAHMFLIFGLARLDVFPTGDLGIKKAIAQHYGFTQLPQEEEMERIGAKWKPYRTLASLYLWKSLKNTPVSQGEISQS